MSDILAFFTFRTVILLFSTTFSILVVMVALNIITVDDLVVILKLSPEAAEALKQIVVRLQEVTHNLTDILSQLLNKLFGWAGVKIDLSKISVDVNQVPQAPAAHVPHGSSAPFVPPSATVDPASN